MGHSRVWSTEEAVPDDNDQISAGAGGIRNHMVDVKERMVLDHIWASSTATDGYHTTIHLQGRGDNPTAVASYMLLYAKTGTSGGVELYVVGSGTQATQITRGGTGTTGEINDSFIKGDWILSSSTGAHTGWTNVSATYANKFIRIGTSGLVSGGSDTDTITLTTTELPAHTHTLTGYKVAGAPTTGFQEGVAGGDTVTSNPVTSSAGSGAAFNVDTVPVYVQTVIFQKN